MTALCCNFQPLFVSPGPSRPASLYAGCTFLSPSLAKMTTDTWVWIAPGQRGLAHPEEFQCCGGCAERLIESRVDLYTRQPPREGGMLQTSKVTFLRRKDGEDDFPSKGRRCEQWKCVFLQAERWFPRRPCLYPAHSEDGLSVYFSEL